MITHKSNIAKLPFTVKVIFKKRNWYLFPQAERTKESVASIRYHGDGDVYEHSHFWFVSNWRFLWLFFIVNVDFSKDNEDFGTGQRLIRHVPPVSDYEIESKLLR